MAEFEAGHWPINYSQAGCSIFDESGVEQIQEDCENLAVNILWNFTNRIFSTREVTLRPKRQTRNFAPSTFIGRGPFANYPGNQGAGGWVPILLEGQWFNLRCANCTSSCQCSAPWSVHVPGPISSITEVLIDGQVVPDSEYRLDEKGCLLRKEGNWPTTQNFRKDITEPETWAVVYQKGLAVPRGGQMAAGILACEFGKAALNDSTCQLPSRVQTITRQGITMAILDTLEDLQKGRVGIPKVDMWIQSINAPRSAATLMASPDWRK